MPYSPCPPQEYLRGGKPAAGKEKCGVALPLGAYTGVGQACGRFARKSQKAK